MDEVVDDIYAIDGAVQISFYVTLDNLDLRPPGRTIELLWRSRQASHPVAGVKKLPDESTADIAGVTICLPSSMIDG
jgi:hypothetical protein